MYEESLKVERMISIKFLVFVWEETPNKVLLPFVTVSVAFSADKLDGAFNQKKKKILTQWMTCPP